MTDFLRGLIRAELLLGEPAFNEYWQRHCVSVTLPRRDLEQLWFEEYIPVCYEENPSRRSMAPSILKKVRPPSLPDGLPPHVPIRYYCEPDWAMVGGDTARAYYDLKVLRERGVTYCSTIFWRMKNGERHAAGLIPLFKELEFIHLKLTFPENGLVLRPCFNHEGAYVDDGRDMTHYRLVGDSLCLLIGEQGGHVHP